MSEQLDWVGGGGVGRKPFKDIRNTRPSAAEEKARLLLELGSLISTCPPSVRNGSVNLVRQWRAELEKAKKVAGNSRSSAIELGLAIKSMQRFAL